MDGWIITNPVCRNSPQCMANYSCDCAATQQLHLSCQIYIVVCPAGSLTRFAITRKHRHLPSTSRMIQCLDEHDCCFAADDRCFFLVQTRLYKDVGRPDRRLTTYVSCSTNRAPSIQSSLNFVNEVSQRSRSLRLLTKRRPLRKSFFKQTSTKAWAAYQIYPAFDIWFIVAAQPSWVSCVLYAS